MITKCNNMSCVNRSKCWRVLAPDEPNQRYFVPRLDYNNECSYIFLWNTNTVPTVGDESDDYYICKQ